MDINDVTVGFYETMPLATFMEQEEQRLSDEEIGKRVRQSWFIYQDHVKKNTPIWQKEGQELRSKREEQKIPRRELSEYIGVSDQTIRRLENGKPVRSRNMMKQSYETGIELISLKRKLLLMGE